MKCRKCSAELPPSAAFCQCCGAAQSIRRQAKVRGNGQGSVYQLPNKKWVAVITVGYTVDAAGKVHRTRRTKSGFRTKREAIAYLPQLTAPRPREITFRQLYDQWQPTHRAGKSTMDCYSAAMQYFRPVWNMRLSEISVDDLQDCIDECERGKRTHENMKALCGLLYKYAIPRNYASLNMGQYLIAGGCDGGSKAALPDSALAALAQHVGTVEGADYILCQCYLGFRPSEFLALDVKDYDRREHTFTGGAKTAAGKNRIVTISPRIQPIIDRLTHDKIAGAVFCDSKGKRMTISRYRDLFYRALEACGIENPTQQIGGVQRKTYTPHSCRHTFATMMKRVPGADRDKLELIGHTSTEMLRHYQDVPLDDLREITNAMGNRVAIEWQ